MQFNQANQDCRASGQDHPAPGPDQRAPGQDYRASLKAVRDMLVRAGSAAAVARTELRARSLDVLTVAARQRAAVLGDLGRRAAAAATGATLSPDMEALLERLAAESVAEILDAPTAIVVTVTPAPASQALAASA